MKIFVVLLVNVLAAGAGCIAWTVCDERATAQRTAGYQEREKSIDQDKLEEMVGRPSGTTKTLPDDEVA
jgi:hypothetical protein